MKAILVTAWFLILFGLLRAGSAICQDQMGSVFRSLAEKPSTAVDITPKEAEDYWKKILPGHLIPVSEVVHDDAFASATTEQTAQSQWVALCRELNDFKRRHAHEFWSQYAGQTATVHGVHYCPCCFPAAIGDREHGWRGWVVRLDCYIAIGIPPGATCYTRDGREVPLKTIQKQPGSTNVAAVGVVMGPEALTNKLTASFGQAEAFWILEQHGKDTSNHSVERTLLR